jgi:hypothetical protein
VTYAAVGVGRQTGSLTTSSFYVKPNTTMRAAPTVLGVSNLSVTDRIAYEAAVSAISSSNVSSDSIYLNITHASGGTANSVAYLVVANGTTGFLELGAEL